MAVLVSVVTSTFLIFRGVTRAWQTGSLRTERYQQARLLFELFDRELVSTVADVRYPLIGFDAEQAVPFVDGSAADAVFFVGRFPGRHGLVERGYWVNGQQQLMCHDDEPADGDYATGGSELCGIDVTQWEASYFDGTAWVDQWDARPGAAQAGQTPKAVRIRMEIGRQSPKQFETVIYVPSS